MIIDITFHCDICDTTETLIVNTLATTLFNLLPTGWGQRATADFTGRTLYCPTDLTAYTDALPQTQAAARAAKPSILDKYRATKAQPTPIEVAATTSIRSPTKAGS